VIIGVKMLFDGIKNKDDRDAKVGIVALLVQGVATSIDALSVGFAFAGYDLIKALTAAMIICVITFIICVAGVFLGKKFGTKFAGKAQIIGSIILIGIGIKIFFF
jgi:putative Mn2+ efflux pump MntP